MKRVLIITYYWPPSGGIGVHRCLKFAKYLRDFGWEPVIFTAKNAQYAIIDEGNSKHIPENLEIHRVPIIEPFSLFKKLSGRKPEESANPVYVRDKKRSLIDEFSIWIRGNLFIPDARALWIRPSVRYLKKYLKNNKIDAILSDGPPHTNTRIAYHISKKFGIPWIADFQDPWTQVDYYSMLKIGFCADRKHHKMELDSFRQAAKITIASPSWAIDLQNIGAKNVDVLYYGYDESDFSHAEQLLNSDEIPSNLEILRNKFVISHLGLMGSDRNPKTMLGVISELTEKSEELKSDLLLFFPGEVDYVIRKEIEQLNLTAHSMLPGHISKSDSILAMLLSSVLLLLLNKADNVKGRLPGKIYEYLRAYKTILTLGPEDSDVGEILTKTRGGVCIDYENTSGIRNFILESYALWKNNNLPPVDKKEINFFDVQNQTKYLAQLLDEITG